jgi:hypothetical protein
VGQALSPAKLALLFLPLAAGMAQEISVHVTPQHPIAADLVKLDVDVVAPKAVLVELPDSLQLDCAMVTEAADEPPRAANGGRIRYRRRFTLDLNGPGTCHIPALPILYGEARLATPQLDLAVKSAIAPDEGPEPDIRDSLPVEPFRRPAAIPWTVAVVTIAGLLAVGAIVLAARWKRPAPRESAEARARRRLAELSAAPAPRREFSTALNAILAEYLQGRFRLRASRYTSAEMLEAVRRLGVLTQSCDTMLAGLLTDCDLARYSAAAEGEADFHAAVALAREIIDSLGAQAASTPRLVRKWEDWRSAAV